MGTRAVSCLVRFLDSCTLRRGGYDEESEEDVAENDLLGGGVPLLGLRWGGRELSLTRDVEAHWIERMISA